MLRTRIITALVLLAFLLPAVFASTRRGSLSCRCCSSPPPPGEWSRLNGVANIAAIGPGALLAL
ncbi:MAG: phosphatidate cytidylyltransferase, partial [Aquincola sp.]|nr:phosphatidate cytidylyltransferase [Aquincola sp.]